MANELRADYPDYSMFSTKYSMTAKGLVRFEVKSYLGRKLLAKYPPAVNSELHLLNFGCGGNLLDGWVNADFFQARFWRIPKSYWMVDLRYPLLCNDNYWDGAFSEQTLEHLHPLHAVKLLMELWRTLKPGCWLRISVPDLSKYVYYYVGEASPTVFSQRYSRRAEAIRDVCQNWGHLSVWDGDLLGSVLENTGFVNVEEVSYLVGTDERLIKDSDNPIKRNVSLYMEAQKP